MASVSSLTPVHRNPHHQQHRIDLILPQGRRLPVACKYANQFSRTNQRAHIAAVMRPDIIKPPPSSLFSVDDEPQVVFKNHFCNTCADLKSLHLPIDLKKCVFLYGVTVMRIKSMPTLMPLILTIVACLSSFGILSIMLAASVSRMLHANTTTLIKLQVGLLGTASATIHNKLNQIAQVIDASTLKGLNYVSTEVSMALLRHIDCCVSGYSSVDIKMGPDAWKKKFKLLSIEERGRLNVNNIWTQSSSDQCYNRFSNEDTVVTILLAVKGLHKIPIISRTADLKEALQRTASIVAGNTQAVEVFWSPQKENDMLWELKFSKDHPY